VRRTVFVALGFACMAFGTVPAWAQHVSVPPGTSPPEPAERRDIPPVSPVFLASAVLPGAAQYMMGDDRWVPYAAAEVWALVSYIQQRQSARRVERRYRDLAWQVARRVSVGERRDTVFEYYEAMAYFTSSGEWLPGGQPETQEGTYNGEIWKLARALYFPGGRPAPPGSAAYQQALQYYLQRAIPPGYAWAWGASNLEQQVFADLIVESDAAFRSATRYLGFIFANHIASSVDALITTRLRQLSGASLDVESTPIRDEAGVRLEVGLRVNF
jgi:hypothetical protein